MKNPHFYINTPPSDSQYLKGTHSICSVTL